MSLSWLPNAISLLRIALVAPILILILQGDFGWALALFVIAGFSDGLDGYLAVRFGRQAFDEDLEQQLACLEDAVERMRLRDEAHVA